MEYLNKGKYYGEPQKVITYNDMIITDNEYTHERVDWHYHENAYFTYILKGNISEVNRKETIYCTKGTLLFHHRQEPHYNIKPAGYTRGFQIEVSNEWFNRHHLKSADVENARVLKDPLLKDLFDKAYRETVIFDNASLISIEGLLLQVFARMIRSSSGSNDGLRIPLWLRKIECILRDEYEGKVTLKQLSVETGVHPVHISRSFPKYFNTTLGGYIRKAKIEKAISLMADKNYSLTEISSMCGFSDQSHFIRIFRSIHGISPSQYRKLHYPG